MSTCQHDATEHLRKAGEHLHHAARTWADQLIHPEVRSHLRDAARSVLNAGLAAIDAEERRQQQRKDKQAEKPAEPAQPT